MMFWLNLNPQKSSLLPALRSGAFVWAIFSLIHVLVNGVALDEALTSAQIISGAVHYPPGHPHQIYYLSAFSLFNYLGAGLWALVPNPFLLSGIHNIIGLFLATFVPYALVVLLTRQPMWGHAASVLTLSETAHLFQGVYPLMTFPGFFSMGHTGLQIAVLIVILLAAGMWRTGGFLVGLLPSIHVSMTLAVWPWAVWYLLRDEEAKAHRKQILIAATLGVAVCAGLAGFIKFYYPAGTRIDPLYRETANLDLIYREFERTSDFHRQPFPYHTMHPMTVSPVFAYFINPIVFFGILTLLLRISNTGIANGLKPVADGTRRRNCLWILRLGAIAWLFVVGCWLLQLSLGSLPWFIQTFMPGRPSNFTAIMLLPLSVTALLWLQEVSSKPLRVMMVALLSGVLLLLPVVSLISANDRIARSLMFLLWGLLAASAWHASALAFAYRIGGLLMVAFFGGILSVVRPNRGAGIVLVGAAFIFWLLLKIGVEWTKRTNLDWNKWTFRAGTALAAACAVYAVSVLHAHKTQGALEVLSDYDQHLIQWLHEYSKPDELILTHFEKLSELQSKTGHPILFDGESLLCMTYRRTLAPALNSMLRDFYGIDYTRSSHLKGIDREKKLDLYAIADQTLSQRTQRQWQDLGEKYGFRLVMLLTGKPVNLPAVLSGPFWTLYVIPSKAEGR